MYSTREDGVEIYQLPALTGNRGKSGSQFIHDMHGLGVLWDSELSLLSEILLLFMGRGMTN